MKFTAAAISALSVSAASALAIRQDEPAQPPKFNIQISAPGTQWDGKYVALSDVTDGVHVAVAAASPAPAHYFQEVAGQLIYGSPFIVGGAGSASIAAISTSRMMGQYTQPLYFIDNEGADGFKVATQVAVTSEGAVTSADVTAENPTGWFACSNYRPRGSSAGVDVLTLVIGKVPNSPSCTQVSLVTKPIQGQ